MPYPVSILSRSFYDLYVCCSEGEQLADRGALWGCPQALQLPRVPSRAEQNQHLSGLVSSFFLSLFYISILSVHKKNRNCKFTVWQILSFKNKIWLNTTFLRTILDKEWYFQGSGIYFGVKLIFNYWYKQIPKCATCNAIVVLQSLEGRANVGSGGRDANLCGHVLRNVEGGVCRGDHQHAHHHPTAILSLSSHNHSTQILAQAHNQMKVQFITGNILNFLLVNLFLSFNPLFAHALDDHTNLLPIPSIFFPKFIHFALIFLKEKRYQSLSKYSYSVFAIIDYDDDHLFLFIFSWNEPPMKCCRLRSFLPKE